MDTIHSSIHREKADVFIKQDKLSNNIFLKNRIHILYLYDMYIILENIFNHINIYTP